MAKVGLGLDIGSGSVKIVQIKQNRDKNEITHYARFPIPSGSIAGGAIINQAAVSGVIRKVFTQSRVRERNVVAAISGEAVMIKHIKLPVMTGPELNRVIRSEIERLVPFAITEATYDWDILHQNRDGTEMEVAVVAAQNQIINSQIQCLRKAGLQPIIMDAQPCATLRALGINSIDRETIGGIAVLEIGATTSQLMVYNEGSIRVTRIIPIAGFNLNKAIIEHLQISDEKAEALKCNAGDAKYNLDSEDHDPTAESFQVNLALAPVLEELVTEIKRSIEYFKLQFHGQAINVMILTGGSSKLRNLAQFLESKLNLVVRLGDPLANLRLNLKKQGDFAGILGNPHQFSVAIGLALRGVIKE
jgi:type IV pilus assembly protein PilM